MSLTCDRYRTYLKQRRTPLFPNQTVHARRAKGKEEITKRSVKKGQS